MIKNTTRKNPVMILSACSIQKWKKESQYFHFHFFFSLFFMPSEFQQCKVCCPIIMATLVVSDDDQAHTYTQATNKNLYHITHSSLLLSHTLIILCSWVPSTRSIEHQKMVGIKPEKTLFIYLDTISWKCVADLSEIKKPPRKTDH